MSKVAIFWFRRDLRLTDNTGLYHALQGQLPVLPLFIFDTHILNDLEDRSDGRVTFIHDAIEEISRTLGARGSTLLVRYGEPEAIWSELLQTCDIGAVYANHDYEPYGIKRDQLVRKLLEKQKIPFHTFKDHVVFEAGEILKNDGRPYTVFTPYSKRWLERFNNHPPASWPSENLAANFLKTTLSAVPTLESMGFRRTHLDIPPKQVGEKLIREYEHRRDFPAERGSSRLGIHFRFGTISIREKARRAAGLSSTFLRELIWRDFYAMILAEFPHVATRSFRPEYDLIDWRNDQGEFRRWCEGQTGYPIVDAGMRELNATGFMHNRVRMITASFLTKHLLTDWRRGEAYFAEKLLDYDLASNNGGWQWAAGSGTDAAPYFRIFNPITQQQKFDPALVYVRHWVPELNTAAYPSPIVDHAFARERCLSVFKEGLSRSRPPVGGG